MTIMHALVISLAAFSAQEDPCEQIILGLRQQVAQLQLDNKRLARENTELRAELEELRGDAPLPTVPVVVINEISIVVREIAPLLPNPEDAAEQDRLAELLSHLESDLGDAEADYAKLRSDNAKPRDPGTGTPHSGDVVAAAARRVSRIKREIQRTKRDVGLAEQRLRERPYRILGVDQVSGDSIEIIADGDMRAIAQSIRRRDRIGVVGETISIRDGVTRIRAKTIRNLSR